MFKNISGENLVKVFFGHSADNLVVNLDADPVAAVAEAECSGHTDRFIQSVFFEGVFHKVNNIVGAAEMAGASYTNFDIHYVLLSGG